MSAIITDATERMKNMSDVDLIPIISPPLVFYIYFIFLFYQGLEKWQVYDFQFTNFQ